MGLIDETYRYLYDTAAYYGTGVEYLIGGIALGVLLILWIIVRLARGKREKEIVVKLMKEEKPSMTPMFLESPGALGGIIISPGEVVIKTEGKTTRIPRDKVSVDLQGGKLEIRVLEPVTEALPKETEPKLALEEPPKEVPAPEKIPPPEEEEPTSLNTAIKKLARKYSLSSITLITPDGLLVDSISKTPEKDAEIASELLPQVTLGKEATTTAVEEEEESKYLFVYPFEESHGVFLIRSKKKIRPETMRNLQEEMGKALKLLLS
jgi:hypothetical protein